MKSSLGGTPNGQNHANTCTLGRQKSCWNLKLSLSAWYFSSLCNLKNTEFKLIKHLYSAVGWFGVFFFFFCLKQFQSVANSILAYFFQAQLQKEEDQNRLELHAKLEKLEMLEKEYLKLTATQRIAEVSTHGMTV